MVFLVVEVLLRTFMFYGTLFRKLNDNTSLCIPGASAVQSLQGFSVRKVNKFGLFDRDYYNLSDTNITRFILLGNSFAEAREVPVENHFENKLEDLLKQNLGKNIEIWNYGKAGFALPDCIHLYNQVAKRTPHKYVLIQVAPYLFDIPDYSMTGAVFSNDTIAVGQMHTNSKTSKLGRINEFVRLHSVTVNLIFRRFWLLRRVVLGKRIDNGIIAGADDVAEIDDSTQIPSRHSIEHIDSLLGYLGRSAKANMLFIYPLPNNAVIYNQLEMLCKKNSIQLIDLDKQLNPESRYPVRGFMNERMGYGHLNDTGNLALAKELYKKIFPLLTRTNKADSLINN